jgi:hypothetical protein
MRNELDNFIIFGTNFVLQQKLNFVKPKSILKR